MLLLRGVLLVRLLYGSRSVWCLILRLLILHSNILLALSIVRVGSPAVLGLSVGHLAGQLKPQYWISKKDDEEEEIGEFETKSTTAKPTCCLVHLSSKLHIRRSLTYIGATSRRQFFFDAFVLCRLTSLRAMKAWLSHAAQPWCQGLSSLLWLDLGYQLVMGFEISLISDQDLEDARNRRLQIDRIQSSI